MKVLSIICGLALLAGIPSGWPYDYYVLLRWLVAASGLYLAYGFYKSNLIAWTFVFGAVSFLFNPLIPIYLSKSNWIPIDFISAILFFLAAYSYKKLGHN